MPNESFQDDGREDQMRALFGMRKDESEGRSGIDAYLDINGVSIPFELKTTSDKRNSVTTVRDFGPEHIKKWAGKHWLFGFYANGDIYYKYATPEMMKPWIDDMENYISPDFKLAEISNQNLELEDLYKIFPKKSVYTLEDAKSLQKRQYLASKYLELQDISGGYSPARMLQILRERLRYLVERGSTLNNPHIPGSYFEKWEKITQDHEIHLRKMATKYLEKPNP
ncbi:hypothetical protein [Polynucleobacter sp.]|uniref:hypothetical protein n=1 Tax=Polynucleobacter sp. TaxID=2029855 RepID=UPI0025900B13|nr:hypothetical protein [Polynucleobacter sp.]MCX7237291.1 hypothetical protein [Polynucleobacter sp.]